MKLSELKNEEAIVAIASLIDPLTKIMKNEENRKAKEKESNIVFVSTICKNNAKEVKAIFAILNGKDPETYECNIVSVATDLLDLISDPDIESLFFSAGQNRDETTSG